MKHQDLMNILYAARGEEQVMQARAIRDEWIKNNPQAPENELNQIYEYSECLEMLAEGYTLRAAGKLPPEVDDKD